MSLRYVGGPRNKRERKRHQHLSWKDGLIGRGPQEVGLRQQILDKEAKATEETAKSRRKVADFYTLECKDIVKKRYNIWRIECVR